MTTDFNKLATLIEARDALYDDGEPTAAAVELAQTRIDRAAYNIARSVMGTAEAMSGAYLVELFDGFLTYANEVHGLERSTALWALEVLTSYYKAAEKLEAISNDDKGDK